MTIHYTDLPAQVAAASSDSLTTSSTRKRGMYRAFAKRTIDVALLVVTAPLTVPVVFLLALIVWLKTGTTPFYAQKRVGRHGHTFTMWKLRTMVVDADRRLQDYLDNDPAAKSEWDNTQKLKNDPRITRTGRILRKTSLDELPQLWNVFVGDMSLVGPRPMMLDQQILYPGQDYYELRPGITGLWQVSDRNESSFAARANFDATYNSKLSAMTDVSILLATVAVVFRGTGY